jgi:hypothetical protein
LDKNPLCHEKCVPDMLRDPWEKALTRDRTTRPTCVPKYDRHHSGKEAE